MARHPTRLILALAALPLLAESYTCARVPRAQPCTRPLRAPCRIVAATRDDETPPRVAGTPAAWLQENVLAGVEPGIDTYTVMVVYFVQGVIGLSALARTFFLKDSLGLSPAEVASLQVRAKTRTDARALSAHPRRASRRRSPSRRGSSSRFTASSPTVCPSSATGGSHTLSSRDFSGLAHGSRSLRS